MSKKLVPAIGIIVAMLVLSVFGSVVLSGAIMFASNYERPGVSAAQVEPPAEPLTIEVLWPAAVNEALPGDLEPYVFQVDDHTCVAYQGALECFCPCETGECEQPGEFGYGDYSVTLPDNRGERPDTVPNPELPERPDVDDDDGGEQPDEGNDDDGVQPPRPPDDPDEGNDDDGGDEGNDGDDGDEGADDPGGDAEDDGDGDNPGGGNNGNNGNGNNGDGVDVSNPGKGHGGPNGEVDDSAPDDDEVKGGGGNPNKKVKS